MNVPRPNDQRVCQIRGERVTVEFLEVRLPVTQAVEGEALSRPGLDLTTIPCNVKRLDTGETLEVLVPYSSLGLHPLPLIIK